ncbi:Bifunctional NAD(P)H-hydrate repair enzyme Nnr [Oligella sp. MSHR50489EDL]|uniref:NAD(P)H-hydrate dehydratase n=1 Tax=Oligella sp. MSHR50489EDL TaxID=3139409 RepID=UPI003D8144A1
MAGFEVSDNLIEEWLSHCQQNFPGLLQERALESHKGSFGTVGIVGGCQGMSGAIVLAGTAALMSGCGKLWLGFCQERAPLPYIPERPELMLSSAEVLLQRHDISHWCVGCGMGQEEKEYEILSALLQKAVDKPILLDADALNMLSKHPELADYLSARLVPAVITPHPTEAARLLDCSTKEVQANREEAALELSEKYFCRVVLKGHQSLIAAPDEDLLVNQSGNPGLATAGSGDVLSGMIISLLAQGLAPDEAVAGGVWLHGAAADLLVLNQVGPIGLCSGEIAEAARYLRNLLISV